MKIAVLNCPFGISAKNLAGAFIDAGLPRNLRLDQKAKKLALQISGALQRARLEASEKNPAALFNQIASAIRYFQIQKCFIRNLGIGRRGNPRTLKLLQGFVLERVPANKEIVTPEGAAILAALCERELSIPSMQLERVGFGPNRLMVSMGEAVAPFRRERILLLETNIDDMSPQGFELLYERLFKAGALDVWVEPILMKKMRPAFKLSVLLDHAAQDPISEVVFKETPSLGVRFLELDRFSLPRKVERIKTRFGLVRVKIGYLDSRHSVVSPEYEDLKRIAQKTRLSFREIYERVKAESRRIG